MKHITSILTVVLSVFLFAACGNESDKNVSELTNKANEQVKEQADNMQVQFVSGVEKNLNEMESGMNEVKAGIEKAEGETKASLQEEWEKLTKQKQELEGMITKVKNNEVDDWSQMKTDIQAHWTSLKGTYDNLRGRLNFS